MSGTVRAGNSPVTTSVGRCNDFCPANVEGRYIFGYWRQRSNRNGQFRDKLLVAWKTIANERWHHIKSAPSRTVWLR